MNTREDPTPSKPVAETGGVWADFEADRLLRNTVVGVFAILVVIALLCHLYKTELLAVSAAFVERAGGLGVFVAWMLIDLLPVPLMPQDTFTTLAYLGGLGFWPTVAWASAGSILGGTGGLLLSRWLSDIPAVHRHITTGRAKRMFELTRKYGALALAVGSVTPMPFNTAAWACGLTGLRLGPFLLVSLLRVPRVVLGVYLVDLGMRAGGA